MTRGTIFDINRIERFTFTQRTEIIPGGLRFTYNITPLAKRELQGFGLTLHLPNPETRNAQVLPWPGFRTVIFPERLGQPVLYEGNARAGVLYVSGQPRIAVVGCSKMAWHMYDDRAWNLNTFRIIGRDPTLLDPLGKGETVSFSSEILLGDAAAGKLPLGPIDYEIDRYGRTAISMGNDKLMEGGLAGGAKPALWLCQTAEPSVPQGNTTGEAMLRVSGKASVEGNEIEYDIRSTMEGKSLVVRYRLRHLTGSGKAENVAVTFAVPASRVTSAPTLEQPGNESPAPASDGAKETLLRHIGVVAYRGDLVVELAAANAWALDKATFDGLECFILATKTTNAGNASQEAEIRFAVKRTGKSAEK